MRLMLGKAVVWWLASQRGDWAKVRAAGGQTAMGLGIECRLGERN